MAIRHQKNSRTDGCSRRIVSETSCSASFCHACHFLHDWMCKRRQKGEAVILQRSHVTAGPSEHQLLYSAILDFLPSFALDSNVQYLSPCCEKKINDRLVWFTAWSVCYCLHKCDGLLFVADVCCTDVKELLKLKKWEMWADLHNAASWSVAFSSLLLSSFFSSLLPVSAHVPSPPRYDCYNNIHWALLEC